MFSSVVSNILVSVQVIVNNVMLQHILAECVISTTTAFVRIAFVRILHMHDIAILRGLKDVKYSINCRNHISVQL